MSGKAEPGISFLKELKKKKKNDDDDEVPLLL